MKNSSGSLSASIAKNPVLVLFLGACPAMAASSGMLGALGVGVAATIVMLLSGLVIRLLGKSVTGGARLPVYVLINAFFATTVQLLMNALLPDVYGMAGIYVAVLAVELVVFNNDERSANERSVAKSLVDSLVAGLILTVTAVCVAAVREVFGSAAFAGIEIPFLKNFTVPILTKAPGGFLVYAIALAVVSKLAGGTDGTMPVTAAAVAGENITEED